MAGEGESPRWRQCPKEKLKQMWKKAYILSPKVRVMADYAGLAALKTVGKFLGGIA